MKKTAKKAGPRTYNGESLVMMVWGFWAISILLTFILVGKTTLFLELAVAQFVCGYFSYLIVSKAK